jgi:hypothetical protein
MVELLIDNIFVEFGGHIVQQNIGIPMGKNGVAHIVDRSVPKLNIKNPRKKQNKTRGT